MGACQGECGTIVVKSEIRIAGRVTGQTKLILILVSANPAMLFIGLGVDVTGDATELTVIRRIFVTLQALHPFIFMLAAKDGEVSAVVIKGRGNPGRLAVARSAIIGELRAAVVGIFGIVKISLVAADAGIGRIVESVCVAGLTVGGDPGVGAFQDVKLVVLVKPCRAPSGIRSVALDAIIG